MAKGSGSTRSQSLPHGSMIARLQNSKNFLIAAGMSRYEKEKNDAAMNYSDMAELTETDRTYLVAYLTHAYGPVNEGLRSDTLTDDVKAMVRGIDRAIAKLESFQGTVYRGMEFDSGYKLSDTKRQKELLQFYKDNIGKDVTEKGYVSTGKKKGKIDKKFTSTMVPSIRFTIESKTGRDVSHYNDEEEEIVFRRKTKFRVLSVKGNNVHLQEI